MKSLLAIAIGITVVSIPAYATSPIGTEGEQISYLEGMLSPSLSARGLQLVPNSVYLGQDSFFSRVYDHLYALVWMLGGNFHADLSRRPVTFYATDAKGNYFEGSVYLYAADPSVMNHSSKDITQSCRQVHDENNKLKSVCYTIVTRVGDASSFSSIALGLHLRNDMAEKISNRGIKPNVLRREAAQIAKPEQRPSATSQKK